MKRNLVKKRCSLSPRSKKNAVVPNATAATAAPKRKHSRVCVSLRMSRRERRERSEGAFSLTFGRRFSVFVVLVRVRLSFLPPCIHTLYSRVAAVFSLLLFRSYLHNASFAVAACVFLALSFANATDWMRAHLG